MKRILVVHGPNLNLLGEREPQHYGSRTLGELNAQIREHAARSGLVVRFFQSNCEGDLIDCLHRGRLWADGVILNPGALAHYSYALRDAIEAIRLPTVEVHLSDVHRREPFRRISVLAEVCVGTVSGKGLGSYLEAIERLLNEET